MFANQITRIKKTLLNLCDFFLCTFEKMVFGLRLEDTACYAGFQLAPAEGFSQALFCPSGKKELFMLLFFSLG